MTRFRALFASLAALTLLVSCAGDAEYQLERYQEREEAKRIREGGNEGSFFDLFRNQRNPDRGVVVNKYLWQASLDTLSFLPLRSADPFSGIILTDWGRVNGAAFRVSVLISDPALDARSLKVAGFRQSGGRAVPVGQAENRALENAILTRAREMRIAASRR